MSGSVDFREDAWQTACERVRELGPVEPTQDKTTRVWCARAPYVVHGDAERIAELIGDRIAGMPGEFEPFHALQARQGWC
jgi:hypothetical protein